MICVGCKHDVTPEPIGFTWWGGALGPRVLNHAKCPVCGTQFNAKTGSDNVRAIRIYTVVASVVALVLCLAVAVAMNAL